MKNKNPKSPLTDSNSELSTKPQSQLMRQDAPHYYEDAFDHLMVCHRCTVVNSGHAESLLEKYPTQHEEDLSCHHKLLMFLTSQWHLTIELPMQQILPESQAEPLDLK